MDRNIEIVRVMLEKNYTLGQIAEITQFSIEYIEDIKKEMNE